MPLMDLITISKRVKVESAPVDNRTRIGIRVTESDPTFRFVQCKYIDDTSLATVDWGDGAVETPYDIIKVTHAYARPGEYEISVTDVLTRLTLSGTSAAKLQEGLKVVSFLGNAPHLTELGGTAFTGCANLAHVELPFVTTLSGTSTPPFANCPQAFDIHFAKTNEEAVKASAQYQRDPQLGAPNAVLRFDL